MSSLGRLDADRGNLAEAGRRTEVALRIAEDIGAGGLQARILDDLGRLRLKTNLVAPAEEAFKKSLSIAESIHLPELAWRANAGLAQVYERRGASTEALSHYRAAAATIESVRGRLALAEDRAGFLQDKVDVYKRIVALLVSTHERDPSRDTFSEALLYAERARARAFLDLLAEAKVDVGSSAMNAFSARRRELEGQIAEIQSTLIRAHAEPPRERNKVQALEARLNAADADYKTLERDIRRDEPQYASLRYPDAVGLAEARELLSETSVLLSYSLGPDASFLFAITRTDARVARLPGASALAERVARLREALSQPSRARLATYTATARELYRELIAPAAELLAGRKEIIVVPEGALHYLPFEVLLTANVSQTNPRDLPYLIRDFTVSYAPSASVLATLSKRNAAPASGSRALVAFGDPDYGASAPPGTAVDLAQRAFDMDRAWQLQRLAYASNEVRRIGDLFPAQQRSLFLRDQATEESVKAGALYSYRYVHFATHGLLNEKRPQFSGLVLSLPGAPGREDGLLQVYEVFNLKLAADLVVLSACETGLGKEVTGEGLVGLTRAFLYAGTPRVVVSLWKVADASTADLMVRFYEHLRESSTNPAAALRRAQLDLIAKSSFAHPYYWAPFVVVGKS